MAETKARRGQRIQQTDEFRAQFSRRLERLLDYLGLTQSAFAERLQEAKPGAAAGLTQSAISKFKSGQRGSPGRQQAFFDAVESAFGISPIYFTSDVDHEPGACLSSKGGGASMGVMAGIQRPVQRGVGSDLRLRAADLARRLGEPDELILALLKTEPPPDADEGWWLEHYVTLQKQFSRVKR
jgi:transcriptional regulator with XRE-family HTH domain